MPERRDMNHNVFSYLLILAVLLTGCQTTPSKEDQALAQAETETLERKAEVNTRLGIEYLRTGNAEGALDKFDKALAAVPNYGPAFGYMGLAYAQLDKPQEAEKNYLKALNLEPDNAMIRSNYAGFLCAEDRFNQAYDEYNKVMGDKTYDRRVVAMANAGRCAQREPDMVKAQSFFEQALSLVPTFGVPLLELARIAYTQDDHLKTRAYLQRYFSVAGRSPESVWLALRNERKLKDQVEINRYTFLLKDKFPNSREAQLLRESANQ